jgi:hypothetical protein
VNLVAVTMVAVTIRRREEPYGTHYSRPYQNLGIPRAFLVAAQIKKYDDHSYS